MPMRMECPFFKKEVGLKLSCEGGILKFPDMDARREFVLENCSHNYKWRKCSIAHCLENYYFRCQNGNSCEGGAK